MQHLRLCIVMMSSMLASCNERQSAFAPFGKEARETADLTYALVACAAVVVLFMVTIYWKAVRAPEGALDHRGGMRLVLWLGAVIPAVLLTGLLLIALPAMRPLPAGDEALRIRVDGEQFWWRVSYFDGGDGEPVFVTANEIRIPVGRRVAFDLTASDVIHSFWIPGLAGKMDMIPGRTNALVVLAEKPGRYRGVCAEFCGLSHALMAFEVVAMERGAFDTWLAAAQTPAIAIATGDGASGAKTVARAGARAFAARGCGGCHQIAGTMHDGQIGPSLSRFGERRTLGAGILAPTPSNIADFIRDPQRFKPGARMPSYAAMPHSEAVAIAAYLKDLE